VLEQDATVTVDDPLWLTRRIRPSAVGSVFVGDDG